MKVLRGILVAILSVLLMISIMFILFIALPTYKTSQNIGGTWGNQLGSIVGRLRGSYIGMTDSILKGYNDGIRAGLAAEDMEVEVEEKEISLGKGKIEVLRAELNLDIYESGGKNYSKLSIYSGMVTFSVNLNEVRQYEKDGMLYIYIPQPTPEIYIDYNSQNVIGEYNKSHGSGDSQNGITGSININDKLIEKANKRIEDYLQKDADESALNQIESMANSMRNNDNRVKVEIIENK